MNLIISIILVGFFLLLVLALLSIVFWSWRNGISPMPTSSKVKKRLLISLPEEVEGDIFELGSGWGTLAFPLARRFPNCQVNAYETSFVPFLFTKLRHRLNPLSNLIFYRQDFFTVPLGDASLIVCYLYPEAMRQLKIKFEKELKPGTWVVSNTFGVPGWKPVKIDEVDDLYRTKIYAYQMPVV